MTDNFHPGQLQWNENERLKAENKRLRGVLLVIWNGHYSGPYCDPAGALARDALREKA